MKSKILMVSLALACSLTHSTAASFAQEASRQHAPPQKVRTPPKYLSRQEAGVVDLYRRFIPSVVTVVTTQQRLDQRGEYSQSALGSGVLVTENNHILTAAHVVEGADVIAVRTMDRELREAELLFSEPSADIALIRLREADPELGYVELGDSDSLVVGQSVYVIGSPYGLEGSFSVGYISGFRDFGQLYGGTVRAEFIQTDAAINSGNSGGPVFNSEGEVIGIASRIVTVSGGSQGLGLVVAINTARQLLALEDRAWMGIQGTFLDKQSISQLLNHDIPGGILIERVAKNSPAEKAGLRGGTIPVQIQGRDIMMGGDLILQFDTQVACHAECLMHVHDHIQGLDKIRVKFLRGGAVLEAVIDVSETRRNFLRE